MKFYSITPDKLKSFVNDLISKDYDVVCESNTRINFKRISSADELNINPDGKPTHISMKEFFFPKSEPLFYYKQEKANVELFDADNIDKKTVILGARPCDAAAVPVLQKVFNWDYKDEFFNRRVENTVVIGMSCGFADQNCFCTSVGLSPVSEKGSDIFLYKDKDAYVMKLVTSKGEELINNFPYLKEKEAVGFEVPLPDNLPQKKFEYENIKDWLDKNFASDFWNEPGELCLGCAQCAYACPTCHCFDIVDEECGYNCGRRMKNWDSCQFGLFTTHASGHNPRENQEKRYRQRVSHKFKYYKDRFDEILCTGCGRCTRGCPAGIDIADVLVKINSMQ